MESNLTTSVGVPAATPAEHSSPGIIDVSGRMICLTWITFAVMAFILYKVAWKPILNVLDLRERSIRDALEDAAKARAELAGVEARSRQVLSDAEAKSKAHIASARASAVELAATIEKQARDSSAKAVDEANREIRLATEKAREALRKESVELALAFAEKVLGENVDSEKNRKLVNKYAAEVGRDQELVVIGRCAKAGEQIVK